MITNCSFISLLNRYLRRKYDDVPAISRFNHIFGPEILDRLNVRLIPADQIVMDPKSLKGKL